jgi:hypothetical protein
MLGFIRKIRDADDAAFEKLWPLFSTGNRNPRRILAEIPAWKLWARTQPLIIKWAYLSNIKYFELTAREALKEAANSRRIKILAENFPEKPNTKGM